MPVLARVVSGADDCCMSLRFLKKLQRGMGLQVIKSGVETQMKIEGYSENITGAVRVLVIHNLIHDITH